MFQAACEIESGKFSTDHISKASHARSQRASSLALSQCFLAGQLKTESQLKQHRPTNRPRFCSQCNVKREGGKTRRPDRMDARTKSGGFPNKTARPETDQTGKTYGVVSDSLWKKWFGGRRTCRAAQTITWKRAASSGGLFYEAMAASMQAEMQTALQAAQHVELLTAIRQTNAALATHGQMCTGMA